jgi:hypothetical protein
MLGGIFRFRYHRQREAIAATHIQAAESPENSGRFILDSRIWSKWGRVYSINLSGWATAIGLAIEHVGHSAESQVWASSRAREVRPP